MTVTASAWTCRAQPAEAEDEAYTLTRVGHCLPAVRLLTALLVTLVEAATDFVAALLRAVGHYAMCEEQCVQSTRSP